MRRPLTLLVGISSVLLALCSAGCGSSAPAITITLTPSAPQTIDQGQAVSIGAALTNDSSRKGVTWSLSGVGTLANQTTTFVTYQAPATLSSRATVTLTATSAAQTSVTATLSIIVNPAPAITTTSLAQGTAGTAYSVTLNESGGTAPLTWGVIAGQVPPGLSLNAGGGVISGTPTTAGTFNFTVQISDAANLSATAQLSITIIDPAPLALSTTSLPNGARNVDYTAVLRASGGVAPYSWSVTAGSLPPGLDLGSSGVISGTPTTTGTASFTVQVADAESPTPATISEPLSIVINPEPFSIATTSLPNGTVGIAYGATLAASGGQAPYIWSITSGALPAWATLNAATGVISGTPTGVGTTSFTVQVVDSESPTAAIASVSLHIAIAATQNALLQGQYAFSVGGYRGGLAGSFTADGKGNITAGTEDFESAATSTNGTDVAISKGSYAVGIDGRGILSFTDANGNTFSFDLALSPLSSTVAAKGAMIETDATGNDFTGFLALQDTAAFSTAAMSGNYVFSLSGWDAGGNADVVVGSAAVASGAVSAGLLDENDGGTLAASQAFTGTLTVGANGRGTLAGSTAQGTFTFYVVSTAKWMAIAFDRATGAVRTGIVQQQVPGAYGNTSVSGTMVFESESSTGAASPQAEAGLLTSSGGGTGTFNFDDDAAGVLSALTGNITLTFGTTNGRFTFSLQATQGTSDYVGYMVAPNQAVVAGTDSLPSLGSFQPQEAGPFTATSLDGAFFFGSNPLVAGPAGSQPALVSSGEMSFTLVQSTSDSSVSTEVLSGTIDSEQAGAVTTSQLTGSYTIDSTGRVTLVPGIAILYVVSSSKAVALYLGVPGFPNPLIQDVER